MEKELKKVRETSEFRLQEVHKDNEKLIKDVKALQEREDIEVILNKVHARHVFRKYQRCISTCPSTACDEHHCG